MTPQEQAHATADQLIANFFGSANRIKIADLGRDRATARCASLWIALLDYPDDNGLLPTTLLPRKKPSGGLTQWYGVAFSPAQSRDFREQLTAFVGPTLSTYRGHAFLLDPCDASENAIIEATGSPYAPAHFGAIDGTSGKELVKALELMARVRSDVETRQIEQVVATGRVVRRFELALRAGRRDQAESHLAYLRRHHRLDQLNLQFLEVQLRAELGLWSEIVRLRHFNNLVQVRRPKAVTDALLRALFETFLADAETARDAAALIQALDEEVVPRAGTLFEVAAGLTSPGALKLLLACAIGRGQAATAIEAWEQLQTATTLEAPEADFWRSLVAPLARPSSAPISTGAAPSEPLTPAKEALAQARFEAAWASLTPLASSPERAAMLLFCAHNIGTLDARQTATHAVAELENSDRAELLANSYYSKIWEIWRSDSETAPARVPANWLEWLDLAQSSAYSDAQLHDFASQGAQQWAVRELSQSAQNCQQLAERLEAVASLGGVGNRVLAGVPALLRFLERDGDPRPTLKPVLWRIRSILAFYGDSDLSQWLVYADLCRLTLALGVTATAYDELIEETELLWQGQLALSNLEAALDTLDVLWIYPCPNAAGRASLANRVFAQAAFWIESGRLEGELERFCRQLARDYGLDELLPRAGAPDATATKPLIDPLSFLEGKSVGIYSLMEGPIVRVRDLVLKRCPKCRIELNHDRTATDALSHLARTADVFVAVTGSATHAATNAIATARNEEQLTALVSSKGSTALMKALAELALQSHDASEDAKVG